MVVAVRKKVQDGVVYFFIRKREIQSNSIHGRINHPSAGERRKKAFKKLWESTLSDEISLIINTRADIKKVT